MAIRVICLVFLIVGCSTCFAIDSCSGLPGYHVFAGSCYKFYEEAYTWMEAKLRCERDQSQLTSIHSAEVQDFLVGLIDKVGTAPAHVRIGGKSRDGEWKWEDGTSMNYENWADSKPEGKGHYIVLSRMEAFKWDNVKRKHESPFLCSQGPQTSRGSSESSFVRISGNTIARDPTSTPFNTVIVRSHVECARRCSSGVTCVLFNGSKKNGHILCELFSSLTLPHAQGTSTDYYLKKSISK